MPDTIEILSAKEARALSDYPALTLGRISERIKAAAENSGTMISYELEYPSITGLSLIVGTLQKAGYTVKTKQTYINCGSLQISW